MSKYIYIIFIPLLLSVVGKSQTQPSAKDTGGIQYIQDARVVELMDKIIQLNDKKDGKTHGFRIQIHFGSDSDNAKSIKSKFIQKYDSIPSYYSYEQPNFKIRVGDFRTRLEAYQFYKLIADEFSGSFIVEDEIELKEVVK